MSVSVLIPTRNKEGDFSILYYFEKQIKYPNEIFILLDSEINKDQKENINNYILNTFSTELNSITYLVTNIDYDFVPYKGVSYVRNFGLKLTNCDYVLMIDDDNTFDENFIQNLTTEYERIYRDLGKYFILSPAEYFKDTDKYNSLGHLYFSFFWGTNIENDKVQDYTIVGLTSSNCLFSTKNTFMNIKFDEDFEFVYEDFDFTYRASKKGYPIIISENISVNHMQNKKSLLDSKYMGKEKDVYQKGKNRILFVRRNANIYQKILYFFFGIHFHNIYVIYLILYYGGSNRLNLLLSFLKGTLKGIFYKL